MPRLLPGILAMAAIIVASNILVQFQAGAWLTWGALTYPFAFLVTDVTNRACGAAAARRLVFWGFAVGVLCSLVAAGLDRTTLRIAVASGTAFLVAQLLDVGVFAALRGARRWWVAPLVSTVIGSAVDTALFFAIAFAAGLSWIDPSDPVDWANAAVPLMGLGPALPLWMSLALADWGVKLALALLALVPFRAAVNHILRRRSDLRLT